MFRIQDDLSHSRSQHDQISPKNYDHSELKLDKTW